MNRLRPSIRRINSDDEEELYDKIRKIIKERINRSPKVYGAKGAAIRSLLDYNETTKIPIIFGTADNRIPADIPHIVVNDNTLNIIKGRNVVITYPYQISDMGDIIIDSEYYLDGVLDMHFELKSYNPAIVINKLTSGFRSIRHPSLRSRNFDSFQ